MCPLDLEQGRSAKPWATVFVIALRHSSRDPAKGPAMGSELRFSHSACTQEECMGLWLLCCPLGTLKSEWHSATPAEWEYCHHHFLWAAGALVSPKLGAEWDSFYSTAGETWVVDAHSLLAPPPQVGGADSSHCLALLIWSSSKEMVQLRAEKYFWIISFVPPISNSISENNRDGYKTGLTKADKRNHVFYKKRGKTFLSCPPTPAGCPWSHLQRPKVFLITHNYLIIPALLFVLNFKCQINKLFTTYIA